MTPAADKFHQLILQPSAGVAPTVAVPNPHKVAGTAVGAAGKVFKVATTEVLGLSQLPTALMAETNRVVLALMAETVALPPLAAPPVAAVYQFKLPAVAVADNTTLVP